MVDAHTPAKSRFFIKIADTRKGSFLSRRAGPTGAKNSRARSLAQRWDGRDLDFGLWRAGPRQRSQTP
jgi:hypothetical protein